MKPRVIFVWVSLWFASSFAIAQEKSITLDEALSIVKTYYESNAEIQVDYHLLVERLSNWEIFVDEVPNANWAHDCKIFKFPNTGDVAIDRVPEITIPSPRFPPDERFVLLSGCRYAYNCEPGEIALIEWSEFHGVTIRRSVLNEADIQKLREYVYEGNLTTISIYDTEFPDNAMPDEAFFVGTYEEGSLARGLCGILLPEGIERIGRKAFSGCELAFFTLPASMQTLETESCYNWDKIRWIYSKGATPPSALGAFGGSTPKTTPIYVPVGSAEAYRNAPGWDYFTTFIETDEAPSAGIEAVAPSSEVKAYWADGAITIMSADDSFEYSIYSIDGRLVSQGIATGKEVRIAAPKSVYVVKSGRNVFKIF